MIEVFEFFANLKHNHDSGNLSPFKTTVSSGVGSEAFRDATLSGLNASTRATNSIAGSAEKPLPALAVVYLNRAVTESEKQGRERFIKAYSRFYPRMRHQLYVVNKGFAAEQLPEEYALFQDLKPHYIDIDDNGFDLEAYRKAAHRIEEPVVYFMNTHSEPLHSGWLDKVYDAFTSNCQVGLVGCTANWETHYPYLPNFPDYPNFHVRTNGFMLAKQDYLDAMANRTLENKFDAYQFEAGILSLTRHILASGRQVLVVGNKGVVPPHQLWRAGLFRSGRQANLLLADNQTRIYQQASLLVKLGIWAKSYTLFFKVCSPNRLRIFLTHLFARFLPWR
jgi:hypothetical protein